MTEYEKRKYALLGEEFVYNARIDVVESLRSSGLSDLVIALIMNQPESLVKKLDSDHYVDGIGNIPNNKKHSQYIPYKSSKKNDEKNSYEEITFETHLDAARELSAMEDLIYEYGFVSVADFWDLMGLPADFSDNKYGWYDLSDADIKMCHGGWKLILPEPKEDKDV